MTLTGHAKHRQLLGEPIAVDFQWTRFAALVCVAVPLEEGLVTPTSRRPSWSAVGRAELNPAQAAGSGTRPPGFSGETLEKPQRS